MPYANPAGRLGAEAASKLGHLDLTHSEWVRDLVETFEHDPPPPDAKAAAAWVPVSKAEPLPEVWAVDGSIATVRSSDEPPREVAFVKTALVSVDRARLAGLDPDSPHPLLLQDMMRDSAVFLPALFPLRNVRSSRGTNYEAVRQLAREALRDNQEGVFLETLKWLAFRGWDPAGPSPSPDFECPHAAGDGHTVAGLPPGSESAACPVCGGEVFLTDLFGLHLTMTEDSADQSVASGYMLVAELLMLFTPIRLLWGLTDRAAISRRLFLKDGPLTLRGQYSKLVPGIRDFLAHARDVGRPVHVCGQEKTGTFVDYLAATTKETPPADPGDPPHYRVLTHGAVRRDVQRVPLDPADYGFRVNWGEKLLLKVDPWTRLALSVPPGEFRKREDFPAAADLIGLDRILATVAGLISRRHESALYPIELAHGVASLSSYPGATVLKRLVDGAS